MPNAFMDWDDIEEKTIFPGYRAKFIHSAQMTFALWNIDAGSSLPAHSHPHEQVTQVLEGAFELTIDTMPRRMEKGSIAVIPSFASHSGKSITDCRILDVFYPVREDYMLERKDVD